MTCRHSVGDDLCENVDDGLFCGVCFLDIEKYFHSINHDILRRKRAHHGVSGVYFNGSKTFYRVAVSVQVSTK